MSETPRNRRLIAPLLAVLMTVPMLLPLAEALPQPSTEQSVSIIDEFGTVDLPGTWVEKRERVTMYAHSSGSIPYTGQGAPSADDPTTQNEVINWLDLRRPVSDPDESADLPLGVRLRHCIVVSNAPLEVNTLYLDGIVPAQDDVQLHAMDFTLYVTGVEADADLFTHIYDIDETGTRTEIGSIVMTIPPSVTPVSAGTVVKFTGTFDWGSEGTIGAEGRILQKGHTLGLGLAIAVNVQGCSYPLGAHLMTGYASAPSLITVTTNSAQLNLWTEDRFGVVTDSFPSGSTVSNLDRRVSMRVVHANVWGNEDCGLESDNANLCSLDNLDQNKAGVRIRDMNPDSDAFLQALPLDVGLGLVSTDPGYSDRAARCCNTAFSPVRYTNLDAATGVARFDYTFSYGADLPDGVYQVEFFDSARNWQVEQRFHVGQTGFSFGLSPGETASHVVNAGEPTDFVVRLQNDGSATDTFGVSVPVPGQGWAASANPGTVTLPPGAYQDITLTVTPPETALNGAAKKVIVSAVSLLDNSVKSVTTTTVITNTVLPGVELFSPLESLQLRPGFERNFPIVLKNAGTAADDFVVTASGAPAGWGVYLTPSYAELHSKSRTDLLLHVTVPPEAVPGTSFTLELTAKRTLDDSVRDVLDLPIVVFLVDEILVDLHQGGQAVARDVGNSDFGFLAGTENEYNIIFGSIVGDIMGDIKHDTHFDHAIPMRVLLTNGGDREDIYTISASWRGPRSNAVGGWDNVDCDYNTPSGHGDGVPDGWRYRLIPTDGIVSDEPSLPSEPQHGTGFRTSDSAPFSGERTLGEVTLAAGESRYAYIELGWVEPDYFGSSNTCNTDDYHNYARGNRPSDKAVLRVTVRSENDDALRTAFDLGAELTATDQDPNENRHYDAALAKAEVELQAGTRSRQSSPLGQSVKFSMVATNAGNEFDDLKLRIGESTAGWDYRIDPESVRPLFDLSTPTTTTSPRPTPECLVDSLSSDPRTLVCQEVGVYDDILFDVIATPPASARIGAEDTVSVVVVASGAPGGDGTVSDVISVTTRVAGQFDFTTERLSGDLHAPRTQSVSFPFTVHNIGTENDAYQLEVVEGDEEWLPSLSGLPEVTVPAETNYHGFLTVTVPLDAKFGSFEHFRVAVRGVKAQETQFLDFRANVTAAPALDLQSDPITVPSGQEGVISVTATDLAGSESTVRFTIDTNTLPDGWAVHCDGTLACDLGVGSVTADDDFDTAGVATADFGIRAPAGELGLSRFPVRVIAETDTGVVAYHDAIVNVASLFGIELGAPNGTTQVIAPGYATTHEVEVFNTGNAPLTVQFSNSQLPSGWAVSYDAPALRVQPQVRETVQVVVTAPASAAAGTDMTLVLFANAIEDPAALDQLALTTSIGVFGPNVTAPADTLYLGPQETGSVVATVNNSGTVSDRIAIIPTLPSQYTDVVGFTLGAECDDVSADGDCVVELESGQAKQVRLQLTLPDQIAQGTRIPVTLTARSLLSKTGHSGQDTLQVEVLPYTAQDIDGDLIDEFAVDRDRNANNGYEAFRENTEDAGITLRPSALARFLSEEAIGKKTVTVTDEEGNETEVVSYLIDGDGDGRVDHFLDSTGDGLPNLYWDPDDRVADSLDTTKDFNGDGLREYLIDVDGDGRLDVYFDLAAGEFGALLKVDVDGDGNLDYIADLDANGVGDQDEPVFYSRTGGLLVVEAIDVDGDGKLDQVLDTDGDGEPDSFIPNGKTAAIAIVREDANGDGRADWTYDADGDGKRDSYYDPATGETGLIDAGSAFVEGLKEYWYVAALFALVAVLFVVLLAVTRR